jgi:dTDP-4-dehydrorhamnose 3,5-epimerase
LGNVTLDDIIITPLKEITTLGGNVLHVMKESDAGYNGFGEAYFSWINSGAVKGWKRHRKMIMNLVVPVGNARFVFHQAKNEEKENFRKIDIGTERFARITVPPGLWFAFQGLSEPRSLILNISQIPHDPNETEQKGLSEINFNWEKNS